MEAHAQLVTLAQAKAHLRVDNDIDDADILLKIEIASGVLLDYLKLKQVPDEWGIESGGSEGINTGAQETGTGAPMGVGVPRLIQGATLLILGELYKNREVNAADLIPEALENLLRRQRDPAMA